MKRHILTALRVSVFGTATALALAACTVGAIGDEGDGNDTVGNSDEELSANTVIARADEWVKAKLHYCQAPNHHHDFDKACASVCKRTDNPLWNPYRSDCSGLVSWAWGLPAPGRITTDFAPFQDDITHPIPAADLKPGDAVNNSDHIMLFKHWVIPHHRAVFIEEPGCSSPTPYAHEFTSDVSISGHTIHVAHNGMTFTAIHKNGVK